jgi:ubiquinone/menaquinone biosynthesis C-methylase UbiE
MNEPIQQISEDKKAVQDFWNTASCGEDLYLAGFSLEDYASQASARYKLEPYIEDFAAFHSFRNKQLLEIGVGLGADHEKFVEAGAITTGIDLTSRAINHTSRRLELRSAKSNLLVADAENLPFEEKRFDGVYSWGVIHHSPNTEKAVQEIFRVLKPGGIAKIMIYNKYSFIGYMLWIRYALLRLKPFTSLDYLYSHYLESPGTKAYSIGAARNLFKQFEIDDIKTVLTHGDLLASNAGQRHRGLLLKIAKAAWPRNFIKTFFPTHGLFLLVTARKPEH